MTTAKKKPARRTSGAAAKKAPAKAAKTTKATRAAKTAPVRAKRPAARGNGVAAPLQIDAKPAKLKLVRDSFTIPRDEYGAIDTLKMRAAKLGRITKKSELLRAGLKLLAACADAGLLGALEAVPPVKTGRPKGKRHAKDATTDGASATAPRNA